MWQHVAHHPTCHVNVIKFMDRRVTPPSCEQALNRTTVANAILLLGLTLLEAVKRQRIVKQKVAKLFEIQ